MFAGVVVKLYREQLILLGDLFSAESDKRPKSHYEGAFAESERRVESC